MVDFEGAQGLFLFFARPLYLGGGSLTDLILLSILLYELNLNTIKNKSNHLHDDCFT